MKNLRHFALFLALAMGLGSLAVAADPEAPAPGRTTSVPLAPDAPSSYTVQRGDTLWGIASKFLSQPWYWPEIWYLNPEVKNPHRIYPGDTLKLVYVAGANGEMRPEIRVERGNETKLSPQVRELPISEAIPAIPFEIVAAFMSKPSVIPKEESEKLPYIVALGGDLVTAGMDDIVYARGIKDAAVGSRYNVVHVGDEIKDPETHKSLGYEGIFAGRARLERAATGSGKNELSKFVLTESARETLTGDRLIRDPLEVPLDFVPHAPAKAVNGQIVAVIGGVNVIGQYQVVVINRGARDGLEPGNVLAVWEKGDTVKDRGPGGLTTSNQFKEFVAKNVQLPNERAGTFMVFKTYERLSYGLIMNAVSALHTGDPVTGP